MFKELGNDGRFKEGNVLDDEGLSVGGPGADLGIACVDHVVRFLQKDGHLGG